MIKPFKPFTDRIPMLHNEEMQSCPVSFHSGKSDIYYKYLYFLEAIAVKWHRNARKWILHWLKVS